MQQLQQHAAPENELRMRAFAVEGEGGEEAEAAVQQLRENVAGRVRVMRAKLQGGEQSALDELGRNKQVLPQLGAPGSGAEIIHVLNGGDERFDGRRGMRQGRLVLLASTGQNRTGYCSWRERLCAAAR